MSHLLCVSGYWTHTHRMLMGQRDGNERRSHMHLQQIHLIVLCLFVCLSSHSFPSFHPYVGSFSLLSFAASSSTHHLFLANLHILLSHFFLPLLHTSSISSYLTYGSLQILLVFPDSSLPSASAFLTCFTLSLCIVYLF